MGSENTSLAAVLRGLLAAVWVATLAPVAAGDGLVLSPRPARPPGGVALRFVAEEVSPPEDDRNQADDTDPDPDDRKGAEDGPAADKDAEDQKDAEAKKENKPEPDERLPKSLPPMASLGVDITPTGGKLPRDFAAELAMAPAGAVAVRCWPVLETHWVAPGSRHFPLYFEQINAERYGYGRCACVQPFVSAAHFFGTIPALPYLMAADCPRECVYTLGHYRPGACPPWRRHCWPVGVEPAVAEAAAVTGMVLLLP